MYKKKTLRLQMISGGRGERHVFSYSFIALLSRSFNWKPSLFIVCYSLCFCIYELDSSSKTCCASLGKGASFFVKISSQNHSKIERQRWRHKKVRILVHGGLNFHRVGAVTKHILQKHLKSKSESMLLLILPAVERCAAIALRFPVGWDEIFILASRSFFHLFSSC